MDVFQSAFFEGKKHHTLIFFYQAMPLAISDIGYITDDKSHGMQPLFSSPALNSKRWAKVDVFKFQLLFPTDGSAPSPGAAAATATAAGGPSQVQLCVMKPQF